MHICNGFSLLFRRPLKLHELLEELENPDEILVPPDEIIVFPPENANEDITDCDSGDEELATLNNLPGGQLRNDVEVIVSQSSGNDEKEYDSDDDIPLARLYPGATLSVNCNGSGKPPTKKVKNMLWIQEDITPTPDLWEEPIGPVQQLTPLQLFEFFFDTEVVDMLVTFSNRYALKKNFVGDISTKEMKCFLGVLILSGYVDVCRRYMYWENRSDTKNILVTKAISRDRFSHIMKVFHVCDNDNLEKQDKYAKLRPLFNLLNTRFLDFAPLEQQHSIDEAMVPYFGKHSCKQFIRGKPIRWGYKLWVGALRFGYTVWFSPYQGASEILPNIYKELGLGSSIILQYADVLNSKWPGIHFQLFFDNFFTSIHLLHELKTRGINATGTLRENRSLKCPLSSSSIMKKAKRGEFEYRLDKDTGIVICRWNDNSVVTIASNFATVFPINNVKRYSQKEKKHINIDQPNLIKSYNTYMGGVDRGDQNISLYRVSIRGKKWYFPLFAQCLDMSIQNAWQLHRSQGGKLDQLEFRRAIAGNILESNQKDFKRGTSKRNSHENAHSRFDGINHLIIYQENQLRCGECHKKVQFRCEKCNVSLHPKFCFTKYHTF